MGMSNFLFVLPMISFLSKCSTRVPTPSAPSNVFSASAILEGTLLCLAALNFNSPYNESNLDV